MARARNAQKELAIFKRENEALRKEVSELKAKLVKCEAGECNKKKEHKGIENMVDEFNKKK